MRRLPRSVLIASNDNIPESSRKVSEVPLDTETKPKHDSIFDQVLLTGRDATEKFLKQNIDNMLDEIYSPAGARPETIETTSAIFHLVNKWERRSGGDKEHRKHTPGPDVGKSTLTLV